MQRIPDSPPQIAPLPGDIIRPFWSVMIPAYNCSIFLQDAMYSVLQQDPGSEMMQIEVVDDCSTDADVEALVKNIGNGRVLYYRQEKNVGSLRNFETCINRAKGYYIHLLHGDDRVKVGYYKKIKELFDLYPEAGAAYCAWDYINNNGTILRPSRTEATEPGILKDWLYKLAEHGRLQYVTITVKREVYEKLGGFYAVTYGEDWEMWARIAKYYPTAYTPEIFAEYREHDSSISRNSFVSGKNIRDTAKVISIISSYLPKQDQKRLNKKARKYYVHWALEHTFELWEITKNKRLVYSQIREILKVYIDSIVLDRIIKLNLRILKDRI